MPTSLLFNARGLLLVRTRPQRGGGGALRTSKWLHRTRCFLGARGAGDFVLGTHPGCQSRWLWLEVKIPHSELFPGSSAVPKLSGANTGGYIVRALFPLSFFLSFPTLLAWPLELGIWTPTLLAWPLELECGCCQGWWQQPNRLTLNLSHRKPFPYKYGLCNSNPMTT